MANGHGGARPGSGRKSTAEKYAPKINAAEKRIADRLPMLIDNMMELANGVKVQMRDAFGNLLQHEDGDPVVFEKPPDRQANEYLLNRIMGKPTERHEHDIALDDDIRRLAEEIIEAGQAET